MSLSLSLVRKLIENEEHPGYLDRYGILRNDLAKDARPFYDKWLAYWQAFSRSPSLTTVQQEVGDKFPGAREDLDYYLQRFLTSKRTAVAKNLIERLESLIDRNATDDIMLETIGAVNRMNRLSLNEDISTIPQNLDPVIAVHDSRQMQRQGTVKFGFDTLDRYTYGPDRGDLVVVAGRPEAMKTYFLCNLAFNGYEQTKKVLIVTLEMTPVQIARRLIAMHQEMNEEKLRQGRMAVVHRDDLITSIESMERPDDLLILGATLSLNTNALRSRIDQLRPDALYVDGAYMLEPGVRVSSERERFTEIIKDLKSIGISYRIPVFFTWQMNRQVGKRKVGSGDNLFGSDAVFQYASWVLSLAKGHYREYLDPTGEQERIPKEIEVAKARERIPNRKLSFEFDPNISRFVELDDELPEEPPDIDEDAS